MITLLSGIFIKNAREYGNPEVRRAYGILCSVVGICLNVLLFAGKFLAGMLSGSVAITADAINNLSDAGSSLITLVGFQFAGRKPDREHPFGHGRIEYVAGLLVSMIIILMGVELVRSSLEKIIHPGKVEAGGVTFVILVLSILIKVYIFCYNYLFGKKLDSGVMRATALDSLGDVLSTSVVLISVGIVQFTGKNVDGYGGLIVAVFILIAGIQAARDTMSPLLGRKPEPEFIQRIHDIVMAHENVVGIHNVIVHDYGPGRVMISLHIEMPGEEDIYQLHDIVEEIEGDLDENLHCESVIHMDPVDIHDENVNALRSEVELLVSRIHPGLSMHDFRVVWGDLHTNLIFDVVIPHEIPGNGEDVVKKVQEEVSKLHPGYQCVIKVDRDYV